MEREASAERKRYARVVPFRAICAQTERAPDKPLAIKEKRTQRTTGLVASVLKQAILVSGRRIAHIPVTTSRSAV
jgi:hypothetical protein